MGFDGLLVGLEELRRLNGLFGWFDEGKLDETAPCMILELTA